MKHMLKTATSALALSLVASGAMAEGKLSIYH